MEKNQDKGFTLVELLIVIVILGILATVTVFAVRGITDKGQENACAVEARTLSTAIEAFYAENQSDPAYTTAEVTANSALTAPADKPAPGALVGAYLKDAPGTDKWQFTPADLAATPTTPASFAATANGPCVVVVEAIPE
jgi:prepilin-type N-terminal cleavage/methylation domain-containing protein